METSDTLSSLQIGLESIVLTLTSSSVATTISATLVISLLLFLQAARQRRAINALQKSLLDADIKNSRSIVQSHKAFAKEINQLRNAERRIRCMEQKLLEISGGQSDSVAYSQVDRLLKLGVNRAQLEGFGFTAAEANLLGLVHDRKH